MLSRLTIRNYALIEELEIDFSSGLNVITGETGAGKSIIMGALGLILGERADATVLVNKQVKCIVEGVFDQEEMKGIDRLLESLDIDPQDELVIRREIAVNGKSRAFINDTPVNLQALQQVSSRLVDLHQQMDSRELGSTDFQLAVLDALANHQPLLDEYNKKFQQWKLAAKSWEALNQEKQRLDKEADYNRFQFDELEAADLKENELENIDTDLKMLANAESIKLALDRVSGALQEGDHPFVQQVKVAANQLQPYSEFHPDLGELIGRLHSVQLELQDIAREIESLANEVQDDPAKMEQLNERLSTGYKLLKKHGFQTTSELLGLREELSRKLEAVQNIGDELIEKEKEKERLLNETKTLAAKITEGRKHHLKPLEEKVNKLLQRVGMPNAKIKAMIEPSALHESGADHAEFLFDANIASGSSSKNAQFQPVRKVASGGELSRLMLCIKSLVAQSIELPTMIFDEIDTGISGEAARQVSVIMRELSAARQLICITHQPQIAGKADTHFLVYKSVEKEKVKTNIRRLQPDERIIFIAKMLSGEKPTAAAMENAREMIQ